MYSKTELAKTVFETANADQNIEPIFNYFASISEQYPDGYVHDTMHVGTDEQSIKNDSSSQDQLVIQHDPLELLTHALRTGNDRFYPLIKFLLDDSSVYKEDKKNLDNQAEANYSLWRNIKWGWAVASAIKVVMQDVKDMLQPHRKLYVMPHRQEKHDHKDCFVWFRDTSELYYINEEANLFAIDNAQINFDRLESISPSVFKLPTTLVSRFLHDDTPDGFDLLVNFDEDSIETYQTTLLNRLSNLQPALDKNFHYLMDQVLSNDDQELRQQFYTKFLAELRRYMPANIEEIAQSIFDMKGQSSIEVLLAKIEALIIKSSKAEDGAQIAYAMQRMSYEEGMQNLSDRKREDRIHVAKLLMGQRQNDVAGYEIPSQYRPLTEHQITVLNQSPNQQAKAGIPNPYTPLTEKQLIALGGSVAHDAIDPNTGSHIYLLALLYRNTKVCSFLKLQESVLHLEGKNFKDITAAMYEQADFSTIYRYTTPSELVNVAREKVMSRDAAGELLRKFDSDLRIYKEEWMIRNAQIKKREISESFSDKTYDALINLFHMKRSFECRGTEVEFYIELVEKALNDPFTSELYNKASQALKTSPNTSYLLNSELPSQVKSLLKEIKSDGEKYMELQPIPSSIVEKYKKNQALATQNNPDEIARLKGIVLELQQEKITYGNRIDELVSNQTQLEIENKLIRTDLILAEERSAIKTAEEVAKVEERSAKKTAEEVAKVEERSAKKIGDLEASNANLAKKVERLTSLVEQLLNKSVATVSELPASEETKSNHSGSAPGFFG